MRGVIISLPPAEIEELRFGRRYVVLSRPIRHDINEVLDVLIYSSKSAGGTGLIEATAYIGQCFQFSRRSYDAENMCSRYGVQIGPRAPGERYYQEIRGFAMLPVPVSIEAYVVSGSTNPPQKDWKYVQIGDRSCPFISRIPT